MDLITHRADDKTPPSRLQGLPTTDMANSRSLCAGMAVMGLMLLCWGRNWWMPERSHIPYSRSARNSGALSCIHFVYRLLIYQLVRRNNSMHRHRQRPIAGDKMWNLGQSTTDSTRSQSLNAFAWSNTSFIGRFANQPRIKQALKASPAPTVSRNCHPCGWYYFARQTGVHLILGIQISSRPHPRSRFPLASCTQRSLHDKPILNSQQSVSLHVHKAAEGLCQYIAQLIFIQFYDISVTQTEGFVRSPGQWPSANSNREI